jgi:hypothetical protein
MEEACRYFEEFSGKMEFFQKSASRFWQNRALIDSRVMDGSFDYTELVEKAQLGDEASTSDGSVPYPTGVGAGDFYLPRNCLP